MKKLFFKLFCAILALSMLVGTFASCNAAENTEDNGSNAPTESNGESEMTDATETPDERETKYNEALAFIEDGKYEEAYGAFKALGDYKDASTHLSRFVYFPTVVNYELSDRSGVMTVTLGEYNLPYKIVSEGTVGKKDSTYTYDDKGNLIKQEMLFNGDVMVYDYSYDADNRHIQAVNSLNGVETHIYDYGYNELGQVERVTYSEGGVILGESLYFYDENGNFSRILDTADGVTVRTYTYTYDEDGNKNRECVEEQDGSGYTVDYFYDESGKKTQESYTSGDVRMGVEYTYDADGNCIKEEFTDADGGKTCVVREYDANGNVTKETRTNADGSVRFVETQYALNYLTVDVHESSMGMVRDNLTVTTEL